jgi:phospholipase/carboxylesterase
MALREERFGELDAVVTGGPDRQGGGDGPVVVLLHGFGAPGDDLVPLWRVLDVPREVRFVFPAAPLQLPWNYGGGRAWWMIDMERLQRAIMTGQARDLTDDVPAGMPEARAAMIGALDEIEAKLGVSGDRIVLGGFSQGAMLSCDVALRTSRKLAGLALMSGTLLAAREWLPLMPARAGLPVMQSHGSIDQLLPFAIAEKLRDALRAAGLPVDWIPFRGGHEIPQPVLDALSRLVSTLS